MMLPVEENFLLLFRRETPLDNSVEFMRVSGKKSTEMVNAFIVKQNTAESSKYYFQAFTIYLPSFITDLEKL